MVRILPAHRGPELAIAKGLVREYAALPHVIGRWADPEGDIAALPGRYQPPSGGLWIAIDREEPVGCAILAPLPEPGHCEMKRLYVRPAARGLGIGERLIETVMTTGRAAGYRVMRLDTAPELAAARHLYQRLGFRTIPRYRSDQLADSVCYEVDLTPELGPAAR